jgi:hypothetical protein
MVRHVWSKSPLIAHVNVWARLVESNLLLNALRGACISLPYAKKLYENILVGRQVMKYVQLSCCRGGCSAGAADFKTLAVTLIILTKRWSYPCNRPWRWDVEVSTFSRQSTHRWWWGCQPYSPAALYTQLVLFLLEAEWPQGYVSAGRIR